MVSRQKQVKVVRRGVQIVASITFFGPGEADLERGRRSRLTCSDSFKFWTLWSTPLLPKLAMSQHIQTQWKQ